MAEPNDARQPGELKPVEITRSEDFQELYANNVQFEISVWDLKLLLGLLDLRDGKERVEHHTSVSIPWPQVKLLSYYLQANIAIHEIEEGVTRLPERLWPAAPLPPPEETAISKRAKEVLTKLRDAFIAEQMRALG